MDTRHSVIDTRLGEITMTARDTGLTGLYFEGHKYLPGADAYGERVDAAADPLLAQAVRELDEYLRGERRMFGVPVATSGDVFSERVWEMLRAIPFGETTTYGALATRLGDRHLAQAVGQAVGHNPVSIVIPCHRVVGADGSLTGYAGGLDRKRWLLDHEEPAEASAARLF
ncbi:methylated-DNA--[protein]-cysteine S-methyltransferase [Tsukamurella sp. 8F]|uniref:methylated-DNA--[protein]-cysteine S-methyltransferase n=1 Tax=unclassified Tsukamurella TaxID=2633480 RepID=UPI0023B905E4|nr:MULTISPECIES: methylated-DNA--[protein]-cysteine S-methyltransferase [unclassified Tsukamurella]MDF0528806.1 methylated-DNA--[protein]-cysteine S-methyltransferase [Tsukamurella sp. 8J]MDF0586641.1 methylated-DNA--[protein]-cysteine S-methyltransferase [Tsukamurella sp. 8F]